MASVIGRAVWAPAVVLLLSVLIGRLPKGGDWWWALHVLGGAALAYSALRLTRNPVFAFALACTGALGWELAEFAVDQMAGTDLQEGRVDTMTDLMLGVSGAAGYLSFATLAWWKAPGAR